MPATVRFHFDFISPYAYLAWARIHALAERHGAAVEPVPVLFAGLLNAHGQKGPAEIPPKRIYVFKNSLRIAHRLGLPFSPPPTHPFNPLLALRAASLDLAAAEKRALIDALFAATWGGGGGISGPAEVAAAASAAGLDGAKIVAEASSDEAKARLRRQTDQAIAEGVFGVPTMIVNGELFWGYDAFEHLEAFLDGKDTFEPEMLQRWASIVPSAQRIKG